jgi:hypothetical protein
MTTYVPFNPAPGQPFSFLATFDGSEYQVVCTWALFGRRWVINVYSTLSAFGGTPQLIFEKPQISSPDNANINLLGGYFVTSTMVFRASTSSFEINP